MSVVSFDDARSDRELRTEMTEFRDEWRRVPLDDSSTSLSIEEPYRALEFRKVFLRSIF